MRSVGDHYLPAYTPIVERRRDREFGERQRDFQLYRRGRYVEFNLVYDPRHVVRPAVGWPHRINSDVIATRGSLALRLETAVGNSGSGSL